MEISCNVNFLTQDIFVDYKLEKVMFRWDHSEKKVYRKFYSEQEYKSDIPVTNDLYNQSLLYGEAITKDDYLKGKF